MNWNDVSADARDAMAFLGDFGPTISIADRQIKGWKDTAEDGSHKVYLDSAELRKMAAHFIEVADWLDKRAANSPAPAGSESEGS